MDNLAHFWRLWGTWAVGGVLLAIVLGFALRFLWPALRLGRQLQRTIAGLRQLAAAGSPASPEGIGREIMHPPLLAGLWREYAQTLHCVGEPRASGRPEVWRATCMAADFFSERALVDTPLKTGYYKHLPGILTGIGIIGTFSGLIAGLSHFEVSSNAESVRFGLRALIQGVGEAFEMSAAAITLAMAVTWVEKTLVTRRYRQVEQLTQLIDGLFDAGVGEEYLARLVRAAEVSAGQAGQLRQAIVGELRQSMEAMLVRQQEIALQQQEALAGKVATAVAQAVGGALKEPLARMSVAVERLGAGQGQVMGAALERALAQLGQRFDERLGQRHDGLDEVLQRTAATMERAVAQLGRMSVQLEMSRAGTDEPAPAAELVGSLEGAAASLARAGREAEQYLENVSAVLARAHAAFAENVERTLARGNGEFQNQVALAVEALRGAIEELADALARDAVAR